MCGIGVDPGKVRQNYLELRERPHHARNLKRRRPMPEDEIPVAKAASFLPGEYAAVRNVLEEMSRRHIEWDLDPGRSKGGAPRVVEFTGTLGPGLW